jgi:hypothetical protein
MVKILQHRFGEELTDTVRSHSFFLVWPISLWPDVSGSHVDRHTHNTSLRGLSECVTSATHVVRRTIVRCH